MKNGHDRRSFLGVAGTGFAGAFGSGWWNAAAAAVATEVPDLIVINAKVYTIDNAMPQAQAFAVRDGKFLAVGSTTDMKSLAGPKTQTYDAKGMTIVPGFIDCHNHTETDRLMDGVIVGNPYAVEFLSIQSIIDKLKARAATTQPDYWVEGWFFDDTKIKDNRPLDVHDLDKVSTTLPVVVRDRGSHTSFYNSKALAMAGITKNTPDAFGGTYDKDAKGELTGRVTDRARNVIDKLGKHPVYSPAQTRQRGRDGLTAISKKFVEYGLTSVHHQGGDLDALQLVRAEGNLRHRVSYECRGDVLEAMVKTGIKTGFGDEWIRFGATAEHGVDGSFSERTMAISVPYIGITPPYTGNVTESQDDLNAWVERVHRAGIQVNCHANGDRAIDRVLTGFERAQKLFPRPDARPKITHCSLINDSLVRRIKAAGAVPDLFTTYAYFNADKFHFYGEALMSRMMAYRTLLDAGVPAAAGSDFGAGIFDPLMGIQGMVTRKGFNGETWGANQKVSVAEAIRVNTLNGAYNSHEEKIKGSITPGKLADFVVLADDPHTVDPSRIMGIKVVRTVVGGNAVFQA